MHHRFLRPEEAAAEIGVHVSTMHRWARTGQIEAVCVRGYWFFPRRAVVKKRQQLARERQRLESMLSQDDVAAYFWVTPQAVRCWTDDGRLKVVRISRAQPLYSRSAIFHLLVSQGYDLERLSERRINTAKAAGLLGVSEGVLLRLVRNGVLASAYTLSGHTRILVSDVEKLRQSRENP